MADGQKALGEQSEQSGLPETQRRKREIVRLTQLQTENLPATNIKFMNEELLAYKMKKISLPET